MASGIKDWSPGPTMNTNADELRTQAVSPLLILVLPLLGHCQHPDTDSLQTEGCQDNGVS